MTHDTPAFDDACSTVWLHRETGEGGHRWLSVHRIDECDPLALVVGEGGVDGVVLPRHAAQHAGHIHLGDVAVL